MKDVLAPNSEREAFAFARARSTMEATPFDAATPLLTFLEAYPASCHSREAAEEVERLAAEEASKGRAALLRARLRELRDPHLPPLRPSTWYAADSHRRLLALEEQG